GRSEGEAWCERPGTWPAVGRRGGTAYRGQQHHGPDGGEEPRRGEQEREIDPREPSPFLGGGTAIARNEAQGGAGRRVIARRLAGLHGSRSTLSHRAAPQARSSVPRRRTARRVRGSRGTDPNSR